MDKVRIGVIGGSGVYEMDGFTDVEEVKLDAPFGQPSDAYVVGTLEGQRVAFLARHGRGHRIMPGELNSRANIWGFKQLGVEYLISISACGSMRGDYAPGHIVVPDQVFDRTRGRPLTFFGDGLVVHISLAEPFCSYLNNAIYEAVRETGVTVHQGGTFIIIEGPRFSTKGESRIFRQWGVDLIGMTTIPECNLAREAEMSYSVMAHVTDYDVWHEGEEPVTVEAVIRTLMSNVDVARQAIRGVVRRLAEAPPSPYANALSDAIITDRSRIPEELKQRLDLLIHKYI